MQDGRFVVMVTKDLQTLNLKFDQVIASFSRGKEILKRRLNQSFTDISSLPKNYSTDLSHFASV